MHPLFFIGSLEDAVREATGPSPISGQVGSCNVLCMSP